MIKLQGLTLGQRMGKAILVLLGAPTNLQGEVGKSGKAKGKGTPKKGATGSTGPRKPR